MRKETKNIQDLGLIFCVKKNFVNFSLTILWLIDWMNGEEKNNFNHLRPFHHHCIFQIIDLFLWGQKKKVKAKIILREFWPNHFSLLLTWLWTECVCVFIQQKKSRKSEKNWQTKWRIINQLKSLFVCVCVLVS